MHSILVPDVTLIIQPIDTALCGQACVAMAADVSLDEAVTAVGCSDLGEPGTTTLDLGRGLRKLGMKVGKERKWPNNDVNEPTPRFPKFAIVAIEDDRKVTAHWVLIKDGFVFDPGIGWPLPVRVFESFIIERAYSIKGKSRWTDILPIYGRNTRRAK